MSSIQTVLVLHITSDHQATSGIIRYPPAPALHNTPMAPPSPHASFWNTRTPHQYELTETRTCRIASYTARCDATSRKAERTKVRPRPYLEHQKAIASKKSSLGAEPLRSLGGSIRKHTSPGSTLSLDQQHINTSATKPTSTSKKTPQKQSLASPNSSQQPNMQLTTLIALAIGLLTGQSYSYECKNAVLYCGSTLVGRKGYSNSDIQAAYTRETDWNSGPAPTDDEIPKSLFKCGASGNKLVWVNNRTPCAGNCVDGGAGSDYCG